MVRQGSGVILMITSGSGAVLKPSPQFSMGGTGPADAAIESFMHYLAETAAFLASDRGSGITGSIINVSSGVSAH